MIVGIQKVSVVVYKMPHFAVSLKKHIEFHQTLKENDILMDESKPYFLWFCLVM